MLARQQPLTLASLPALARLAAMVTPAHAHTLAVATRVTAEEAATLDAQLKALGTDLWARGQRQRLEEAYAAVEEVEQELHKLVASTSDAVARLRPCWRRRPLL